MNIINIRIRVLLSRLKMYSNCRLRFFAGFNWPNHLYLSSQVIAFYFLAMVLLMDNTASFIVKDCHNTNKP